MSVLVTGAAGFIGSSLAEALTRRGDDVVGLDCFTDYYGRDIKESNLAPLRARSNFRFVEDTIQSVPLDALLDGVTHRFIRAALTGTPVTLYGDGEQTRDFTYVDDIVAALMAAGDRGRAGAVYNIGGGSRVSINQVLARIEQIAGRPVDIRREPAQKGDMRDTFADTTLARTELGFVPRTSLADGLRAEYEWLKGLRDID